jgi:hypothetical protein
MTPSRTGPSKKLVPSLGPDRACEHRFVEDEAMTLEVDCRECSGAQSIDNPRCAAGMVNVLASGVLPEAIVLRRYIDVRYRSERIAGLRAAAAALAALRRLADEQHEPSDRRCRTCPASRGRLASELVRRVRADPASFCSNRARLSDVLARELSSVACPRLAGCIGAVVSAGRPDQGWR